MVYSGLAALIFCGFIVFDTNNMIKRYNYDDYIWAAVSLYLDVINLFMVLVTFFDAAEWQADSYKPLFSPLNLIYFMSSDVYIVIQILSLFAPRSTVKYVNPIKYSCLASQWMVWFSVVCLTFGFGKRV